MGLLGLQKNISSANYTEFILPLPNRKTDTIKSEITGIEVAVGPNSDYMNAEILIDYCGTIYKRCGMLLTLSTYESLEIPLDNFPVSGKTRFSVKVSGINCPLVILKFNGRLVADEMEDVYVTNLYENDDKTKNTTHDSSTIISVGLDYFNKWCRLDYDSIWAGDSITIAIRKNELINFEKLNMMIKHLSTNLDEYSEHAVSITKRDLVEHKNFYTCELKMSEKLYPDETLIEYELIATGVGEDLPSCEIRFYFPSSGMSTFNETKPYRVMPLTKDKAINLVIKKGTQQPIDEAVANLNLFG